MIPKMIVFMLMALFGHAALAQWQTECNLQSDVKSKQDCLAAVDVIRHAGDIVLNGNECRVLSWNSCAAVVCNQRNSAISINGEQLAADTMLNLYDYCIVQDHYGKWWDADKKVEMHTIGNKQVVQRSPEADGCDIDSPVPQPGNCRIAVHNVLNYDTPCYGLARNRCNVEQVGDCVAKVCNLLEGPAVCMNTEQIKAMFEIHVWKPCIAKQHYGTWINGDMEVGLVWKNSSQAAPVPDIPAP
ncbi:hypothetical protein OQA88_6835 [Cercophora sp. LCS_1]